MTRPGQFPTNPLELAQRPLIVLDCRGLKPPGSTMHHEGSDSLRGYGCGNVARGAGIFRQCGTTWFRIILWRPPALYRRSYLDWTSRGAG